MHRTFRTLMIAGAAAFAAMPGALAPAVGAATTAEDVIARHVEARGGAEKWKAINSLRLTGSMTSWSRKAPFTLEKRRDSSYHLDSVQDGKKVEIGYDGKTAWWDNHFFQEGAQKIKGADLAVLMREVDFTTPFFDYKDKGYEVKLLGPQKFEGRDAIALELKRKDGLAETWYLDPATYLEIARESPGSDFGRPVPLHTFYDDFRVVSGVKIPFRVESQWYTRERVLDIEKVETNVTLEDDRFAMPPPMGMGPLLKLVGSWKVAVSRRNQPSAPWQESERVSRIEALMGGGLLQERFTTARGAEVLRSFTYDRFRKRYRMTEIDDSSTLLDVNEGELDPQKGLVVSNVTTGTSSEGFGMVFHGRFTVTNITADSFNTQEEISTDGGKEWFLAQKTVYTRKPE